jgi:hypothetical protein
MELQRRNRGLINGVSSRDPNGTGMGGRYVQ